MPLCLSLLKHIVFFSSASHLTVTFFPIYGQKYENSPAKKKLLLCNLDNHLLSSLLLYSYILKRFTKNENFVLTKHFFYAIIIFSKVENNALSEVGTGSCPTYEKLFGLRCCFRIPLLQNRYFSYLFAVYLQKGFFIMKKEYLSTKKICTLAMLIAVSVILGMLSIRFGPAIKISFKFIGVFLCSMLFGPVAGGLCGGISDFLAYFVNPGSGAMMWQITIVEVLYGISFGLFFSNSQGLNSKNFIKLLICLLINTTLLSLIAMSYILKDLMGITFYQTLIIRIPSAIFNFFIQLLGISYALKYSHSLRKIAGIK